jgi:hypothetical protein
LGIDTDIWNEPAAFIAYLYTEGGATVSSEISATIHKITWYHNPDDHKLNFHSVKKNLKSHIKISLLKQKVTGEEVDKQQCQQELRSRQTTLSART